ncbi:zinc ribbon domain-containing protein [Methanonatronarchaeum thermophilum]|uniref:zinc ribbon domain-containing protein n=1 Tax=Methanonatronarchaeum thermophilum TaxID=1927129 RepID=UPI00191BBD45|nr:zinc ribbon domain-containing protein [Methanonatronarchaeum thermophilum]
MKKLDPKDTSKECSQCGVKTEKKLWQREHSCPSCGYTTDRDYNAAQNILGKGLTEVTPAETATSTDNKHQIQFCNVSASYVIETGNPFHTKA